MVAAATSNAGTGGRPGAGPSSLASTSIVHVSNKFSSVTVIVSTYSPSSSKTSRWLMTTRAHTPTIEPTTGGSVTAASAEFHITPLIREPFPSNVILAI